MGQKSPLRVVVADDTAVARTVTSTLLDRSPAFEVVGVAADGLEAVRLASELQPDVVLLDHHMPGLDGIEAIPLVRAEAPNAVVVLLSADPPSMIEDAARRAGAAGTLHKASGTGDLAASLHAVVDSAATRR